MNTLLALLLYEIISTGVVGGVIIFLLDHCNFKKKDKQIIRVLGTCIIIAYLIGIAITLYLFKE